MSWDRTLIGRAGYYIRITVNPENADEVVVMNSSSHRSLDGGLTWSERAGRCGDCHDVWMDPTDGDHWAVTGDGGAGWTTNHGENYSMVRLPNGQMYHRAVGGESRTRPFEVLKDPAITTSDEDMEEGGRPAVGRFVSFRIARVHIGTHVRTLPLDPGLYAVLGGGGGPGMGGSPGEVATVASSRGFRIRSI
ncbi:MAG: hypothetical protein OEZ65_08465 [Gemmatimonadota bacterium]|nr:hypothetical protein [Gemmatimonadota bacterium]